MSFSSMGAPVVLVKSDVLLTVANIDAATAQLRQMASDAGGKADVRKLRWGMTRAEVQQAELPLKPAGALGSRLEYRDTILTEAVRIVYSFQIDSLIGADLLFSPGPGREGALHRILAQTLEDKYGKPKESLTGRYGQALYTKQIGRASCRERV